MKTATARTDEVQTSIRLEDALRWARKRVRARRTRRGLAIGLVVLVLTVAGAALVWRSETNALIRLFLVGLGLMVLAVPVVSRLMPMSRSSLVWLVDRAFFLEERLVTLGDRAVASDRFCTVIAGEIEGRLTSRSCRTGSPPGSPSRTRRVTLRLGRWRWHVLLVFLVVLVLGVHALVTTPRLIARLPGDRHHFAAGTPIPLHLLYRVGPDRLTGLRVVVDDQSALQLTEFAELLPGGNENVNLLPYLRRARRLTSGEHAVTVLGAIRSGREVASDRVVFTLEVPPGTGGQGSSGGESPSAGGPGDQGNGNASPDARGSSRSSSESKPKNGNAPSPRSATEPSASNQASKEPEKPEERSPPDSSSSSQPRPPDETPRPGPSERPPESEPAPRFPSPDPPRPLGAPKRTEVKTTPRFVMPLLDDKGGVLDKERWVLRHLPGGTQPSGPEPARESTSSWRDRVERYQRQIETVMDRRGVDDVERARFLRYLNALKRP